MCCEHNAGKVMHRNAVKAAFRASDLGIFRQSARKSPRAQWGGTVTPSCQMMREERGKLWVLRLKTC